MRISVVILTFNEALHIERCIRSVQAIAADILVVDSGSTDGTREIATRLGARVLQHSWVNHATQLNWALEQGEIRTEWVMRLDADEIVDATVSDSLRKTLRTAEENVSGFEVRRYVVFQGKVIRHGGGVSPGVVLRIWRNGYAVCESRWMDEHMLLKRGVSRRLPGSILDHNLNSLTWWIQKHNAYASCEAVDLLNLRYSFLPQSSEENGMQITARTKRVLKEEFYARLPVGVRALLYFFYRVVLRLGFLDGPKGVAFHFMQGLWYRVLVDLKVTEVIRYMQENKCDVEVAIHHTLGINLGSEEDSSQGEETEEK